MSTTFQQHYLDLVSNLERDFPVALWQMGDINLWPLARLDLFLDMQWQYTGQKPPASALLVRRVVGGLSTPVRNVWKSRRDLKHFTMRPVRAHAVLLGDGVSLDYVDGTWQDRFGEPIVAEFARRGQRTFVMQPGDLSRLPWKRTTFAANVVSAWSKVAGTHRNARAALPDVDGVHEFLCKAGVNAPSLERNALERKARAVCRQTDAFEYILRIVQPELAFVVTYYAGLGAAYLLACRRLGILSIDLQHCPQEGAHKAYEWSNLPPNGYGALPAIFWNWSNTEAEHVRGWTRSLAATWHRSIAGGNTQLAEYCGPHSARWVSLFKEVAGNARFARDILVALQPFAGQSQIWDELASAIEAAPRDWRWWIRRHPSSRHHQDTEFGRLLGLRGENVLVDEASSLPLPALLPHMSVVVSLMSGAAGEAEMFGVPAFFLSVDARGPFSSLIERGSARIVPVSRLNAEIGSLPELRTTDFRPIVPAIGVTLDQLEKMTGEYADLIRARRSD